MRAVAGARDATLISVLAYAGLRPGEALALQWRDVREQTILIERALSLGQEDDTKTDAHRTVRLLSPLAADLREWRLRSGRPGAQSLVFPSRSGRALDVGRVPVVAPACVPARRFRWRTPTQAATRWNNAARRVPPRLASRARRPLGA